MVKLGLIKSVNIDSDDPKQTIETANSVIADITMCVANAGDESNTDVGIVVTGSHEAAISLYNRFDGYNVLPNETAPQLASFVQEGLAIGAVRCHRQQRVTILKEWEHIYAFGGANGLISGGRFGITDVLKFNNPFYNGSIPDPVRVISPPSQPVQEEPMVTPLPPGSVRVSCQDPQAIGSLADGTCFAIPEQPLPGPHPGVVEEKPIVDKTQLLLIAGIALLAAKR